MKSTKETSNQNVFDTMSDGRKFHNEVIQKHKNRFNKLFKIKE